MAIFVAAAWALLIEVADLQGPPEATMLKFKDVVVKLDPASVLMLKTYARVRDRLMLRFARKVDEHTAKLRELADTCQRHCLPWT